MKRLVLLFLGVLVLVFANNVRAQANTKTLLYLHSPSCGYCVKFEPVFKKISKDFAGKCNFKKVDARSFEGRKLMQKYNGFFLPYVLTLDDKTNYKAFISPDCVLNYACMNNVLEEFVNK